MLSRAEYSVITAEGCSAILFRSADKVAEALEVLQPTATHMKKYGIIDEIVKEAPLGRDSYIPSTLKNLQASLAAASKEVDRFDVRHLREELRRKIEKMRTDKKAAESLRGDREEDKSLAPQLLQRKKGESRHLGNADSQSTERNLTSATTKRTRPGENHTPRLQETAHERGTAREQFLVSLLPPSRNAEFR